MDHVLINWVNQVEDFIDLLLERLNEWRLSDGSSALTSDVEDVLLTFLHTSDEVLERNLVLSTLAGVESEKISELLSVGVVLMDTELKVLGVLLVELLVVLLVLSDLSEHLETLLDDFLLDDLEDYL